MDKTLTAYEMSAFIAASKERARKDREKLPAYKCGETAPVGSKLHFPGYAKCGKAFSERIVSDDELSAVNRATTDVGTIQRKIFDKRALRMVPKALHSIYGLPMRDRNRTSAGKKAFRKRKAA